MSNDIFDNSGGGVIIKDKFFVIVPKNERSFVYPLPEDWKEKIQAVDWVKTFQDLTSASQRGDLTTGTLIWCCLLGLVTLCIPYCFAINRAKSRAGHLRHISRMMNLESGARKGFLLKYSQSNRDVDTDFFEVKLITNPAIKELSDYQPGSYTPITEKWQLLKWFFQQKGKSWYAVRYLRVSEMRGKQVLREYVGEDLGTSSRYSWVNFDDLPPELPVFNEDNYLYFYVKALLPCDGGYVKQLYSEFLEEALSFYGGVPSPFYYLDLDPLEKGKFKDGKHMYDKLQTIEMDADLKQTLNKRLTTQDLEELFQQIIRTYQRKKGSETNYRTVSKLLKSYSLKTGSKKGVIVSLVARTFGKSSDGTKSPNVVRFPRKWTLQIHYWKPLSNIYIHILRANVQQINNYMLATTKKKKKKKKSKEN